MIAVNSNQILILFCFLALGILTSKNKVERYLQIVLIAFIFMDFAIPPGALGIKLFDALTILIVPFFLSSNYYKNIQISGKLKLFFAILLSSLIFGSLYSLDPLLSILRLCQQLNFFIFFIVFTSYISISGNFKKIKNLIITSICISLLFTLIQIFVGTNFTLYSFLNPNVTNEGLRFPGPFHDPQKFAQYLALSAFLFFSFSTIQSNKTKRYIIIGILVAFTIILTGSRGALFGFAIGMLFYSIVQAFNSKKLVNIFIIGAIGFSTYLFSENTLIFKRVESSQNDLAYRYSIWIKAYDFFLENPISGIGTGSYQAFSEKNSPEHFWKVNDEKIYFDHPESGFLLWLVEYGIVGFIALISVILIIINPFYKRNKKVHNLNLNTYLEAGIISWIVGFITVNSLGDKRIGITLLLLFGVLFIAKYNWKSRHLKFLTKTEQ